MTKNQAIDKAKKYNRESGDPYYVVRDMESEFYIVLNRLQYKEKLTADAVHQEFVVFSIE
ncbi:hypothetical protein [Paenibacillus sp. MBLB4367]|uniref:hypothetical protein n=1 Tax=Paenibacillus sp. MBLB4367 TaxID=3384767 RepID=UPI00390831A9